ncbi:hypothetical protein PsorP6_002230 [Peronosclerospora sorghi]|uniref:Uncharacterized protein n=1 Tax=Peronosclerospora sorghi TaxID=230839 RepID=A0ACC0WQP3_9STRA|nr:hypothetical protein PsorP6_002230 [Peronosclerospora sorghi]
MAQRTSLRCPIALDDEPMLETKSPATSEWNVEPSAFSKLVRIPFEKLSTAIKKPSTAIKTLIPLSLGDPTVFRKLHCPDVLVHAIIDATQWLHSFGWFLGGPCGYRSALWEFKSTPEKKWEIDSNQMQSLVDDRTKGILINNPSNPCGSMYSKVNQNSMF